MKAAVNTPSGVGAWQVTCEHCGGRYGVFVALEGDDLEASRPRFCNFCARRVAATFAVRPT